MLIIIPADTPNKIIEVPPKLMNGKVIPVVGKSPITTIMLINALTTMLNASPKASN